MIPLPARYTTGTHRVVSPEQTLANISRFLPAMGITRCADVTGLDSLGISTYCAIRPPALTLQVSNGKGLTPINAKVSALMEAIELYHAEYPIPEALCHTSLQTLHHEGVPAIHPDTLEGWRPERYFTADTMLDWVEGEALLAGTPVWLPASSVYFYDTDLYKVNFHNGSTNGLASGNHRIEAILHAFYEVIERDALFRLSVNGRLKIREKCKVINLKTISDARLRSTLDRIEAANTKLVLLWIPSCVPLHTFWAVLLNREPFSPISVLNMGYGTHACLDVAAVRAITEAAQSRLAFIHAAREDIRAAYTPNHPHTKQAYIFFDQLKQTTPWPWLEEQPTCHSYDLAQVYTYLLSNLEQAGHHQIFCCDLTRADFAIPVVKVLIPSLFVNEHLV